MPYRILHIADAHLDMAFAGLEPALGDARRKQLQLTFERALALAQDRRADALCIAGDLYESERTTPDRAAYLTRVLGALAPMRVFISPGNHDPYDPSSLYRQMTLPSNVMVFTTRRFTPVTLADGVTLWGSAHEFALDKKPILEGLRCEGAGVHLLLFHGSDRDRLPPGKECIAPFVDTEIHRAGAAHAMVGHYHAQLAGRHYGYPGSLEPHTAAQDGRHTAALVSVERGKVHVEYLDINETRFERADLDLSSIGDRAELEKAARERVRAVVKQPGHVFCTLRLTGAALPSLDVDANALQRDLAQDFPGVRVEAGFVAIDAEEAAREGHTVRAAFAKDMLARIRDAGDVERPLLEQALRYGLLAFADKRLAP